MCMNIHCLPCLTHNNVYEYSLSPFVLHIIICMNIHCAKKERIWQNTGEMMTFIQQQIILLTVDTTQSYIQMATIHTCTLNVMW